MQRSQSVKLNIKLDKFKTLITATTSLALSFAPSTALFYAGLSYGPDTVNGKLLMFAGAAMTLVAFVVHIVMRSDDSTRDNTIFKLMSGSLFSDALDAMTAKKFKKQTDSDIRVLRESEMYNSMSEDKKDKFYLLCAQIEQENTLYASLYEQWSSDIYRKLAYDKNTVQEMTLSSSLGGRSFGWENLVSLLRDVKGQKWFESDRFELQLSFVRGQVQKEKFEQSKNAHLLAYVESFTKSDVLDKSQNTDCQMYTNAMLTKQEYQLKDSDYNEIAKALKLYGVLAFDKIHSLLQNLDYPRVDWQKYKSVVQECYFSNDENYKKFIILSNKKILTQMAISGVEGTTHTENETPVESKPAVKEVAQSFNLMPKSILLEYEAHFNPDLWAELKRKCNLIYDNQAIVGEATVRELNVKLATALPLLMASDGGMKRTGLGSQSTKDLLRENVSMMVQEVDLLVGDLEKKLSMGVAVGNKYMKMRA